MKMQVIEVPQYGPPEVLQVRERAIPTAAKGEVLIWVDASGVCRPDLVQRQGFNPPPPGASDVPGREVSGTIAARGPGVTRFGAQRLFLFTIHNGSSRVGELIPEKSGGAALRLPRFW